MDRLDESKTQRTSRLWGLPGQGIIRSGKMLLALGGLITLSLTGCPASPSGNNNDMGTGGDLSSPTDMNSVRPQQPGCSKDEWCWLFPQPQGNTLWSVWGSSASDAWATGESGTLLHYTGGMWKPIISPTKSPLYSLWGVDANDVYAVGDRSTILHYDGQNWSPMTITGSTSGIGALYGVWGTGKDDVWIVGAGGVVLHKVGGTLSRVQTPNDPAYQVLLKGVWGTGGTLYAVGAQGSLLKFDGTTWSASVVPGAMNEILTVVTGTAANNLFVASLGGAIRRFDGTNWNTVSPFGNFGIYSLWASGSDVFAVGDVLYTDTATKDPTKRQGIVKKWNGTMFTDVAGTLPVSLYSVWGPSATDLFMVGASGTILRYNGSGFTSSSPIDNLTGVGGPLNAISGSAQDNLVTVGDWGTTLKWNGTQWSSVPSSIYLRFRGLSGPLDNLWSVAFDATPVTGGPRIFQWQGSTWSNSGINLPGGFTAALQAIWVAGSEGVAVGFNDTVLRRNGANWQAVTVTPRVGTVLRSAWGSDAQNVWIVGGGQEGPTGEEFTGYPGKILFYNGTSADERYTLPESDQALRAVWGTAANNVYAVGLGGTVLRYDGQAWKRQDTGTSIALIGVFGAGKDVFAVGYSGAILHKLTQ